MRIHLYAPRCNRAISWRLFLSRHGTAWWQAVALGLRYLKEGKSWEKDFKNTHAKVCIRRVHVGDWVEPLTLCRC